MWREIQDKFQIKEGSSYINMQAFSIDTMQCLYRLRKTRLHYYYKSKACGQTDEERLKNPPPDLPEEQWEYCVARFGSDDFKVTFNFLTQESNGVKPPADVIWLIEHTKKMTKAFWSGLMNLVRRRYMNN